MMLRWISFTLVFGLSLPLGALSTPSLANVPGRLSQTLNGQWHAIVDPYETGFYDYRRRPYEEGVPPRGGFFLDQREWGKSDLVEYSFDRSGTLMVPGDWNSQRPDLHYYEGTVWYRKLFEYTPAASGNRVFVHFGGANYETHTYLNGQKLGTHVGGFTPFWYEITEVLREGDNSLVVKVDNSRHPAAVPTVNTDWWNFGGLTRDVTVVEVPPVFIADYRLSLVSGGGDKLDVSVSLEGAGAGVPVEVAIEALGLAAKLTTDAEGVAHGQLEAPGLVRWSPEHPQLYAVEIAARGDVVRERLGFRTIATEGHEILLNGDPIFLRGISLHEENPLRGGRAWSREDAALLLGWARELGCNFVRLAHYPHNDHVARLADEMGLLVWAEIPVYWTIDWENPDTLANARNQLAELITRDRNRASVIVWSVANETPVGEARTAFLKTLVDDARQLDGTRLVSAAMEVRSEPGQGDVKIVDDPFGAYTDVISFNQYVGWYDGLPDRCAQISFEIAYDKPVIVSEFGAGALQGFHADDETRFSEEFQADLYRQTLPMLERMPHWRGVTPWILVDFQSPRRPLPGIQDGWNRKGLISQHGVKKAAFEVLREYYQKRAEAE